MPWETSLVEDARDKDLAVKIVKAIRYLLDNDLYLLEVDANERAISHWLGTYIQKLFPEWNVDCEYNRNGHDPKRLGLKVEGVETDDDQGRTVYPDIILHKRGGKNYLVIEIKKRSSHLSNEFDIEKLKRFKLELNYEYALFLMFQTRQNSDLYSFEWIEVD
jgi:hypothetical protein